MPVPVHVCVMCVQVCESRASRDRKFMWEEGTTCLCGDTASGWLIGGFGGSKFRAVIWSHRRGWGGGLWGGDVEEEGGS